MPPRNINNYLVFIYEYDYLSINNTTTKSTKTSEKASLGSPVHEALALKTQKKVSLGSSASKPLRMDCT